jgi:uroporphyrinogen decarboxylase
LPELVDGRPVYRATERGVREGVRALVAAGARFVGGCCGTSPAHLRAAAAICARPGGATVRTRYWERLVAVMRGEALRPLPTGFIVDSRGCRGAGQRIFDYFASEQRWLVGEPPRAHDLPGHLAPARFGAEYGMCTEPSAFGASGSGTRRVPLRAAVFASIERRATREARRAAARPVAFVIQRLAQHQVAIEREGQSEIRFAVARAARSTFASFLLAPRELLTSLKTEPRADAPAARHDHRLPRRLDRVPAGAFPVDRRCPHLDDVVGFISRGDSSPSSTLTCAAASR